MNAAPAAGQQAVFASSPATSNIDTLQEGRRQRNKKFLLWLGITEIIIGLTSCALGVVTLGVDPTSQLRYGNPHFFHIGQGIWCGFILIISGILGVVACNHPTKAMYRANLALSMLGVIVMVILLFTSAMAASSISHTGYFIALSVEAFVGIIITSAHCGYSNVERTVNTRTPRYNGVGYGQVPLQQFTAFQMPNGQLMYYPSQVIPSASMYPSHVPGAMVHAPMTAPNVMHPMHPAQSGFPATMAPTTAAISSVNQPAHPTQSVQYPTTVQNGQAIVYPPYSTPMAYYPTTVPAPQSGYVMPTHTLPVVTPEPNQQMPVNTEAQQSSNSQEVANSDNDPPMHDDPTGPLL